MTATTSNDLREQLATCYKENHRKLYFCAYAVVRNFPEPADAARDMMAQAFCKALDGSWRGESSLYTFLYTCTRNLALDHIRRHEQALRIRGSKGENIAPCADSTDGPNGSTAESRWQPSDVTPRPFPSPEGVFLRKETRGLINEALAMCSGREQAVFELCKFDGMSTVVAADTLGVSQPTAHRALAAATAKVAAHVQAMTC